MPWHLFSWQTYLIGLTTLYGAIAAWREDRVAYPGQRIDVGGYQLHLAIVPAAPDLENPVTLVLDHSLGGVEGYLMAEQLAIVGTVCFFDRAGYGWSDHSPHARTSDRIVTEIDRGLTAAGIAPPYLLVGDSFGSYNMRLYAHRFPEKVAGLVLTDGLHEAGMLKMPIALHLLQSVFLAGFGVAIFGGIFGIQRVLRDLGFFALLKPELKRYSPQVLQPVTRSFCRMKHWVTMFRELWSLADSGRSLQQASQTQALPIDLPIASIKAASFFLPSWWTHFIPLKTANQLRDQMHDRFSQLSDRCCRFEAPTSGHFVWTDQPEVMLEAVKWVKERMKK